MDHLEDARIIDLLDGADDVEASRHLRSCPACNAEVGRWEQRLIGLRALEREAVSDSELHRLQVMYRQLGPKREPVSTWVARIVRGSPGSEVGTVATRSGGPASRFVEYAAGPFGVVLQVGPSTEGGSVIHGQILAAEPSPEAGGRLVVSDDHGRSFVGDISRHGEFHLEGVPDGVYGATWLLADGRVELDELQIGAEGDG